MLLEFLSFTFGGILKEYFLTAEKRESCLGVKSNELRLEIKSVCTAWVSVKANYCQ